MVSILSPKELPATEWNDWPEVESALSKAAHAPGGSSERLPRDMESKVTARLSRIRQGSRAFVRYLIAICIGVAATSSWHLHGDAAKQIMANGVPQLLDWSHVANWIPAFGLSDPSPDQKINRSPPAESASAGLTPQIEEITVSALGDDAIGLPARGLLEHQSPPQCELHDQLEGVNPSDLRVATLDYERQCYRQAEGIVRARLDALQGAVGKKITKTTPELTLQARAGQFSDGRQIEDISRDLAALRLSVEQLASLQKIVEQLAVGQERIAHDIAQLQSQRQKTSVPLRPPVATSAR